MLSRSLERRSLRIRDFEAVLAAGKLGRRGQARTRSWARRPGQMRELYLASLEQVDPALRDVFQVVRLLLTLHRVFLGLEPRGAAARTMF